ncbi:hypothetical protein F5ESL0236_08045 [Lactobacillus sp. ESL0236]|uniref:hypothetical protein n=1 Tax=unclassified Lactobacillus TaxID=2620435 RepID=UPI000EFC764A|nr:MULTISPECIES: hypothetical protein [unclassified Lactobacillus]RMC36945.1 hypothetical protein F5ESL0237_07850 [Lactobacillus sp. ESL0237]RMC42469.1 hypothetical protein F5ESL0234_08050 [Lactobacillus sp. ESL0234]RMC43166.1 hypothetical protein F5ESL0236_08045 [Lactobacillus sp. ESL0236]
MKEITKTVIRFTDFIDNREHEVLLDYLYLADAHLYNVGSSEEPEYKLKYHIRFNSMGTYEVSKEDYDWCVDCLKAKAGKHD